MLKRIKTVMREHKWLFILLFAQIFIYHAWFLDYSIRTHGDWVFSFPETLESLRAHYFTVWLSDQSFGRILIDVGQAPTYASYGFLSILLGLGFEYGERIIHFWPSVILSPIGAYFLALYCLEDKRAAIASAVVYSFNTYALILQTGHLTLSVAYALSPFVLLSYIKLLDNFSLRHALVASVVLALCGAYEPRAAYIVIGILFLYALYRISQLFMDKVGLRLILKAIFYAALPVLVYGLLSAYWVVGLLAIDNAIGESVLSRGLFGNEFQSLPSSLTLQHPFWNFSRPVPFIVNDIPVYFWIIPVAAFVGLYCLRKNPKIVFFGLLALVGILLSKQVDEPFRSLYGWLFANIPGFNAFRESSKFYFVTSLAYAILIAAFVKWAIPSVSKFKVLTNKQVAATLLVIVGVGMLFAPNLVPIITGKIGTTFANRSVPNDYAIFRKFILDQPDFFRIYWTPRSSRWGVQTSQHPRVESTVINETDWKSFTTENNTQPRPKVLLEPLLKPYSDNLLDQSSIKYVVVPIRDSINDDDFFVHYGHDRQAYIEILESLPYLKRIDIGTKELAVYENNGYKPHVTATTTIVEYDSIANFDSSYTFVEDNLNIKKANFMFARENSDMKTFKVADLFNNLKPDDAVEGNLYRKVETASGVGQTLHAITQQKSIELERQNGELSFYSSAQGNLFSGKEQLIKQVPRQKIGPSLQTVDGREYIIKIGTDAIDVPSKDVKEVLIDTEANPIEVYSLSSANLIPNPSFENGLWRSEVQDCNNYDDKPEIYAELSSTEHSSGSKSLEMAAVSHTACTGPGAIPVNEGSSYQVKFDYKILRGRQAGLEVKFNDKSHTLVKSDLISTSEEWTKYQRVLSVPRGATQVQIVVKAVPDDRNLTKPTAYFDNFRLSALKSEVIVRTSAKSVYQPIILQQPDRNYTYTQTGFDYDNLIRNPSMENGLWKREVGDCDAHDDNPKLDMQLNRKLFTEGGSSLELGAARHVACTGPVDISVRQNAYYMLSFDYQSDNSKEGGFNIGFNDNFATNIRSRVQIKNNSWNTYTRLIKAPRGATRMQLLVYAYADSTGKRKVNRYDNFKLVEIPDLQGKYYSVTNTIPDLVAPKSITNRRVSQSEVKINIRGADTPFYLTMSEKYHPQWIIADERNRSQLVDDDRHFQLNTFMNGWYIDPKDICTRSESSCTTNTDGTIDIEVVAKFSPQKWFNWGLVVSLSTLCACFGYLIYAQFKSSAFEGRGKASKWALRR